VRKFPASISATFRAFALSRFREAFLQPRVLIRNLRRPGSRIIQRTLPGARRGFSSPSLKLATWNLKPETESC
jgi:hypothetical protein